MKQFRFYYPAFAFRLLTVQFLTYHQPGWVFFAAVLCWESAVFLEKADLYVCS